MTKKVAIQGDKASFHDAAAQKFYSSAVEIVCCETLADTFDAVVSGQAESALCAIENSLFGSINKTYDLLVNNNLVITGEVYVRIVQCLIVVPGTQQKDIKEVYSHPVALAQCEEYLDKELPEAKRLEFYDTAASVEKIKQTNNKQFAAIASREAASLHGMAVLAEEIETNKQNYTRFVVLEPKNRPISRSNKTSLIIKTAHHPGALYKALGVFAQRSINLSWLQSRPIIGKAWHYIFYVDVDQGMGNKDMTEAIDELNQQGCEVKILGSYIAGNKV
jgi:prephenate dehydratase